MSMSVYSPPLYCLTVYDDDDDDDDDNDRHTLYNEIFYYNHYWYCYHYNW